MRLLGLDVGEKRIGVAVSDEMGWTAQGIGVWPNTSEKDWFERISELVEQQGVAGIVLGYPKNMNGSIGDRARQMELLAEKLRRHFQLPVHLWDERLSTVAAGRLLVEADLSRKKRKQVIDKTAAVLILQGYLDYAHRNGDGIHGGT